jgi:hypothetical protein
MKVCFKCNIEKEEAQFYRHSAMADGYLNKRKDCTKADVKNNYIKNIDRYKEYFRERAKLPSSIQARKDYVNTEKGKEIANNSKYKWTRNNPIKRMANIIVGNAEGMTGDDQHLHFEFRSQPICGRGLTGRIDPLQVFEVCPLTAPAYLQL